MNSNPHPSTETIPALKAQQNKGTVRKSLEETSYSLPTTFSSNTATTINSTLVLTTLQQAQVQNFKTYVGRQGEREQLQELNLPLTPLLRCFFFNNTTSTTKSPQTATKGETKQTRILCSNNPSV